MSDDLTCPRCQGVLRQHVFGAVTVDGCEACGGLWFDTSELAHLARGGQETVVAAEEVFAPPLPTAQNAQAEGQCPRCHVELYAFQFEHTPEVTLDACPQCRGVWIDDGELAAIGRRLAPAQGAAEEPRSIRRSVRQAVGFMQRVKCERCGEENPQSARVCWACGATIGYAKSGRMCPRCDGALDYISAEDLEIRPPPYLDHCPHCGGLWVQADSLSRLMELTVEVLKDYEQRLSCRCHGATETKEGDIICPTCQAVLRERPYAGDYGAMIDHCRDCAGTWLDGGELAMIKRISIRQDLWGGGDVARK